MSVVQKIYAVLQPLGIDSISASLMQCLEIQLNVIQSRVGPGPVLLHDALHQHAPEPLVVVPSAQRPAQIGIMQSIGEGRRRL